MDKYKVFLDEIYTWDKNVVQISEPKPSKRPPSLLERVSELCGDGCRSSSRG